MDWSTDSEVSSFNLQLNTCNVLRNEGCDNFLRVPLIEKDWFSEFTVGMEDKKMHVIHSLCLVYWAMTLVEWNTVSIIMYDFYLSLSFFVYMKEGAIP